MFGFFWKVIFPEEIRLGAPGLLRELHALGHEIWIYTSSNRSRLYLRLWFRLMGVRLSGVVNAQRHLAQLRKTKPELTHLSKYPPLYNIDLHIDDS